MNRPPTADVYGVGNALVDFEYAIEESFLAREGIAKGHMTLVDEVRIAELEARLAGIEPGRASGGSAANTVFAVKGFGGQGAYSCRLAEDAAGDHFVAEFAEAGIHLAAVRAANGRSGRCLTLVTADAERTMTTCLGASAALDDDAIDEAALAKARCCYVEGYLAAAEGGRRAAVAAREIAEANNVATCLSLSDPSMVAGCRAGLEEMLGNGVGQLFCNEEEALDWAGTDRLEIALTELRDIAPCVHATLGARGSFVAFSGGSKMVPGYAAEAVDTTGAGDIFAGAVLYAQCNGAEAWEAARFGNFAAAALVAQHGARLPGTAAYRKVKAAFRA